MWLTSVGVVVSGSGRAGCKAEASCWTCCTGVVVVRCGCGCGLEFSLATCARTQPPARSDSSGCVLCTWVRPVVGRLAFTRGRVRNEQRENSHMPGIRYSVFGAGHFRLLSCDVHLARPSDLNNSQGRNFFRERKRWADPRRGAFGEIARHARL